MFTDNPVTPNRIEVLIDVLRDYSRREWTRGDLVSVLAPSGLPDLTPNSKQASDTIAAAKELGIVSEENQVIQLTVNDRKRSSTDILLNALDERVAATIEVEPYFGPFFAYVLTVKPDEAEKRDGEKWAIGFNRDCPNAARSGNPFNKEKRTGLNRWYAYTGHGWFDPNEVFQPNPYVRIRRRLPKLFQSDRKITGEEFFVRLAESCPELDGGEIFLRAITNYDPKKMVATPGLSHALVDLHFDHVIRLHCAADSRGWSIEAAHPPNDGKTLNSGKVDYVEYCC